jgi:hypothetical protein
MQINELPASDGLRWLREGWRLLKRQPLGLPAMSVIYLFIRYGPMLLIPLVGLGLAAFLAPFAVVGMMAVCRETAASRTPQPAAFAAAFRAGPARPALVRIGLFHMAASLAVALFVAAFAPRLDDSNATLEQLVRALPAWLVLATLAAELVVLMLMWFAPLFAAWHRQPAGKSLFFSFFAVWRNRGAFAVFAVVLSLAMFVALQFIGMFVSAFASRELAVLLIAPLVLALVALVQAAAYVSYTAVLRVESNVTRIV